MIPKTNVKVKLTERDGNVYNLVGIVRNELKKAGRQDLAKEFVEEALSSHDYDAVIQTIMKYVHVS